MPKFIVFSIGSWIETIIHVYVWPYHVMMGEKWDCEPYYEPTEPCSWQPDPQTDWGIRIIFGVGSALVLWGITLMVMWWLFGKARRSYVWRRDRRKCHGCSQWTTRRSSGEYLECMASAACCLNCNTKHAYAAVQRRAASEPVRSCTNCGHAMAKEIHAGTFIIDACGQCGGLFLDRGEMDGLQKLAEQVAYNRGYRNGGNGTSSSSNLMWFALGTAIG